MDRQPINLERRWFLRKMLPRLTHYCTRVRDEYQARPQMLLSDLGHFPDSVLRTVVPVFCRDTDSQISDCALLIQNPETGNYEVLMDLQNEDTAILRLFGQDLNLDEIANQLDDGAPGSLYPKVKSLFLSLARCAICHPAQSLVEFDPGN